MTFVLEEFQLKRFIRQTDDNGFFSKQLLEAIHNTTMNAPGNAFISFCFNKGQTSRKRAKKLEY